MSTEALEQSTADTALTNMKGAFVDSLQRNNKKIRSDRAVMIAEDAQMSYKRKVEDIAQGIKRMKRERESMLDMSPSDVNSLVLASDFNADAFVTKDIELGIKIRQEEIRLEVAQSRYKHLFGEEVAI